MKKSILATIYYMVDNNHPDIKYIKNPAEVQSFTDCYNIDLNEFYDKDDYMSYIKNDLRIIAGGGYDTNHIHNVSFKFSTDQNEINKFTGNLRG